MGRLEITLTGQQITAFNANQTVTLKVPKLYEKAYLGGGRIFDIVVDPNTYRSATYLTYGRASKVNVNRAWGQTWGAFYLPEKADYFTIRKAHPLLPDADRLTLQLLIVPVGEKFRRVSFTPSTPVIKTGLVPVGGGRYKIFGKLVIGRSDFSKIFTFQEFVSVSSLGPFGNALLGSLTIILGNDTVLLNGPLVGPASPSGEVFLVFSEFTTTKTSVILPVTIEFTYLTGQGVPDINDYYRDVNLYFTFGQKADI
jgi:hypothetical protein